METIMKYKGFFAQIMEAERLIGDQVFGLPPGQPLEVFYADQFEKWPEGWMHGAGVFLIPVRPNKGLWFSWVMNDSNNTAILPTVKGCNPITGMQTSGFHLERYETKCPKHGCDFIADRFCPECDYKWPPQSYICQPPLWLDGFFTNGHVRQFFFTEDELRDVATGLIGRENVIPAFGFAFYRPKEPRVNPQPVYRMKYLTAGFKLEDMGNVGYSYGVSTDWESLSASNTTSSVLYTASSPCLMAATASVGEEKTSASSDPIKGTYRGVAKSVSYSDSDVSIRSLEKTAIKEVSVGSGARINQSVVQDPYPFESWKDIPDAVMTIYFVFQEKFEELKAGGFRTLEGKPEGMLTGIPVG